MWKILSCSEWPGDGRERSTGAAPVLPAVGYVQFATSLAAASRTRAMISLPSMVVIRPFS